MLVSAVLAVCFGLYLLCPITISLDKSSGGIVVQMLELCPAVVALFAWVTVTLVAIQLFAWIRTGTPDFPDPITLLLSSIYGDFIHDPVLAKRIVCTTVGVMWLVVSGWAILQRRKDAPLDDSLAALEREP